MLGIPLILSLSLIGLTFGANLFDSVPLSLLYLTLTRLILLQPLSLSLVCFHLCAQIRFKLISRLSGNVENGGSNMAGGEQFVNIAN